MAESHKWGSPPRVRGKVDPHAVVRTAVGITPACAGKRPPQARRAASAEDHPRVCGEKQRSTSQTTFSRGSPPRVRGKVLAKVCIGVYLRITPACAGKRATSLHTGPTPRDHPRVCGEKSATRSGPCGAWGSPPRVRGKDSVRYAIDETARITPACAGKRALEVCGDRGMRDHPACAGKSHPVFNGYRGG